MEKKKVLIGLSGGVDSSVSALLLKKQGYEVIGAFMKNFSDTKDKLTGECSYLEDKKMAQKIAIQLKIPLIVLDFEKQYKKEVIEPMLKSYEKGITPNPDITCNSIIKFPLLWNEAKKIEADYIATGHYARIKKVKNGFELHKGTDKEKDQSYFLYELDKKDLEHTLFPLGTYTKKQVREIARKNKFPNADKQGSRGICFVGKVNMQKFLEKAIPSKKGQVLSEEGKIIGEHRGQAYYTLGQRAGRHIGINITNNSTKYQTNKLYIASKDVKKNEIVVAPRESPLLYKKEFIIENIHLLDKNLKNTKVRIRHLGKLMPCKLVKKGNNLLCKLNKPISDLADGQAAVIYKNTKVLGGGEIKT